MNRSEAMAPLGKNEGRFPATIGMIYRGMVRKAATRAMVDFYEEKGFFESVFIFRGPVDRIQTLHNFFKVNF
jgi:hypothetical protein